MKNLDKYRGCLVGGAAGDALGYPVEFFSIDDIIKKYGKNGITEYTLSNGIAQISDDTQMTLFTANGLLLGTTRGMMRGIMGSYPSYISYCYKEWYKTQTEKYPLKGNCKYTWLSNIPELFSNRAPGNTCMQAINIGANGTIEKPINDSKGCGGIMRVAPIGLYFEHNSIDDENPDMIGAETAALTHGHEFGYISAAMLVHIINLLSHGKDVSILQAVLDAQKAIGDLFPASSHLHELFSLVNKAKKLSRTDIDDVSAITELGEGWVAEETLAIAIYCSLKYPDNFDKALTASVNHSGDSDSTGAVTGNIMGAYLGISKIPKKYIDTLELKNVIIEVADDLYQDCKMSECSSYRDNIWMSKYSYNTYRPKNNVCNC